MNKRRAVRSENLRLALAQEAARVMAEHGIRDFLAAKRVGKVSCATKIALPMSLRRLANCAHTWRLTGAIMARAEGSIGPW